MNVLDFVILLFIAAQVTHWAEAGFARRFFSITGFWIGVVLGALATPFVLSLVADPLLKLVLTLVVILSVASMAGSIGTLIGYKLKARLLRIQLGRVDMVLGAFFGLVTGLLVVWAFAAIVSGTPFQTVNRLVRDSAIVRQLNNTLPPAPGIFSRIAGLINPERFPQIFVGPEPRPVAPVNPPTSAELASALESAGLSTVRLESAGCGGNVFGSGFVAAPDLVVTNAHVVAGIETPLVVDQAGRQEGTVVFFDPDLDMAIVRAESLAGEPLTIDDRLYPRGTTAATLGYPDGGPLEILPTGVLRSLNARGYNIYNEGIVEREIYMLQTTVRPGNSGGPVVLPDGTVIGMIFGRSQADDTVGYAITGAEIMKRLSSVRSSTASVSTGRCAQ